MINVYVLYNDNIRSKALVEDCKASLEDLPNNERFNIIPVLGYTSQDAISLFAEQNIPVTKYYRDLLNNPNLSNEFRKELNGAMCATMGHAKIWQLIAESNSPSIVLEHDAIFKSCNFDLKDLEDFMIFWLGPRVSKPTDYEYPKEISIEFLEVLRFEGVHAYAITPRTASYLLEKWKENGFIDSIDGFLAMRNYYSLTMVVLDPPPLVAAVNRDGSNTSSIEEEPAYWNAKNTKGFLKGLKVQPPLERIVEFENKDFISSFPWVSMTPPNILAFSNDDGTSIKVLANQLLSHTLDCKLDYICTVDKGPITQFKSYFSNYYYKIQCLGHLDKLYTTIDPILQKIDTSQYSLGYIDCVHLDHIDTLYNSLKLLDRVNMIMVHFNEKASDFIDVLTFMGYECKTLGTLVTIRKVFT